MPAWLLAAFPTLVGWFGNKAAAVVFATAAIALTISAAALIVATYVVPHVPMPAYVYQILTVVGPSDWAAQTAALMGIKSLSMVHRSSMYLLDRTVR